MALQVMVPAHGFEPRT